MVLWARMVAPQAALALLYAIAVLTPDRPAEAQMFNNVCATQQGNCIANPAPIGSPCGCMSAYGPIPGQILPPIGGYAGPQQQAISNACRTYRGICQTYPAPIGSPCGCYGDPGMVIGR